MRNLSLKGLEGEDSVRNHNLIKNSYFNENIKAWRINEGQAPPAVVIILNEDIFCYTSSFPYQLTLPLLVSGGIPPYTWSCLPYTPEVGKIDIPSRTISANTIFGSFPSAAVAQVLVQVTDSRGIFAIKMINITLASGVTPAPTTPAPTTPAPTTTPQATTTVSNPETTTTVYNPVTTTTPAQTTTTTSGPIPLYYDGTASFDGQHSYTGWF